MRGLTETNREGSGHTAQFINAYATIPINMSLKLKDLIAGNTRRIDITFTDSDGNPYNLTSATIKLVATPVDSGSGIAIDNITNPTQFVLLSATNGQVRITLSSTNTTLTAGTYNFGAQATLTDGTVVEDTGSFKVKTQYVT